MITRKSIVLAAVCLFISPGIAHPPWILRPPQDDGDYRRTLQIVPPIARAIGRLARDEWTMQRDQPFSSLNPEDSSLLLEAIRSGDKERVVAEMQRIWGQMSDEQRQAVISRYHAISNSRRIVTRGKGRSGRGHHILVSELSNALRARIIQMRKEGMPRSTGRSARGHHILVSELSNALRARIIQMRKEGMPRSTILHELKKTYEQVSRGIHSGESSSGPTSSSEFDLGASLAGGAGGDSHTATEDRVGAFGEVDGTSDFEGAFIARSSTEISKFSPDGESSFEEEQEGGRREKIFSVSTTTVDPGSDLLGTLLKGKIGDVDWMGMLTGNNGEVDAEHGNALAQLLGNGNFLNLLGPAD
uniref:Uncharacterized protein n=1 Tax=Plectus sambesii TaxID=2011161 RepID=A0A914WHQ9_9BILA